MIKLDNRLLAAVSLATLIGSAATLPTAAQDATNDNSAEQTDVNSTAGAQPSGGEASGTVAAAPGADSVVAEVNGTQIRLSDVQDAVAALPPQMQQFPEEMIVQLALDQLVARELILAQARESGLESDPEVQNLVETMMERITDQALVQVWIARQLEEQLTDERLQEAFASLQRDNPDTEVTFEQVRPQIEQALRQQVVAGLTEDLRQEAEVVFFDAAGNPTERPSGAPSQSQPNAGEQETSPSSSSEEDEDLLGSAVTRADTGVETDDTADANGDSYGSAIAAVTGWETVDLDAVASASDVSIVPLSTLQGGSEEETAALETALAAHAMAKADVHAAAETNSAVGTKLEQEGFATDDVVAIRPASGGAVIVYVDDRA